ncbi:MAG: uroporphyrinogen decarboxylase family protein [Promethearchaeota archaeon]
MNSFERVKRAIEFECPDRVPYFGILKSDLFPMFLLTPRSWQPPEPYMPYVHPLELRLGVWRSKRKLPKGWLRSKHVAIDEWGVVWERHGGITTLGQVIDYPIKTWDQLVDFITPDPRNPQRFSLLTKLSKILGRNKYKLGSFGNFFFERYHFLRGWESTMRDLVKQPKQAHLLLERLAEYYMAIAEEWIARGVNGIIATDDLGGQAEPLMSPIAFRKFFAPYFKKIIDFCHDNGVHFMLHSCGDIKQIMPILVEIGVDVFQFDAPDQTGIEFCSENYGGKVAFMNVVDIQNVLPRDKGSSQDITTYVVKMIYYLGRFDGGLIGQEYPTPKVLKPHKNAYKIMRSAYKKYGKYPLDLTRLQQVLNK